MQREIDTRNKHEENCHALDCGVVEIGHAGIMGGKATDGHGGEAVADGIEQIHPCHPVSHGTGDGEEQIDIPQCLRRLSQAWNQLVVLDRAGALGTIELHATDTQHG